MMATMEGIDNIIMIQFTYFERVKWCEHQMMWPLRLVGICGISKCCIRNMKTLMDILDRPTSGKTQHQPMSFLLTTLFMTFNPARPQPTSTWLIDILVWNTCPYKTLPTQKEKSLSSHYSGNWVAARQSNSIDWLPCSLAISFSECSLANLGKVLTLTITIKGTTSLYFASVGVEKKSSLRT